MKEEVQKFKEIFEGFNGGFGVFHFKQSSGPKQKGKSYTSRDPLTDEVWLNHLHGKSFKAKIIKQSGEDFFCPVDSIGIAPTREDHKCKWGCIDIDQYPINFISLNKQFRDRQLPLILCKSKSKGAHAFLFAKDWRSAINDDGTEATLEQFFNLHTKYALSEEELNNFTIPLEDDWFKEGPMCLKIMATFGFVEGHRNNTLIEIGVYLKKRFPDSWRKKLGEYNTHCFKDLQDGPLSTREVLAIETSVGKNDYFYGCKKAPLKPFCRSHECRLQKFGVGDGNVPNNNVSKLSVMMSNPKVWFLTYEGKTVVLKSRELATQRLWQIAATEQTGKTPQLLKQRDWETLLNKLQANVNIIPADPETTNRGKLRKFLTKWCLDGVKVQETEGEEWETAYGDQSPFIDKEGTVWFQIDWFKKFLDTQKEWEMDSNQTHSFIHRIFKKNTLGGEGRKENKRCFFIQKDYFEELEELEPKDMKGPEIPY